MMAQKGIYKSQYLLYNSENCMWSGSQTERLQLRVGDRTKGGLMAQQAAVKAGKRFTVPAEFMKAFEGEIRFVPKDPHNNGYMMFDHRMLIAALRSADPAMRERQAAALLSLEKQWDLVLISKPAT